MRFAPAALSAPALFCALAVAGGARPAWAHALDVANLEVRTDGPRVRASLDLSADVAESLTQLHPLRTSAAASAQARAIFAATLGSGALQLDGASCAFEPPQADYRDGRIHVAAAATCPGSGAELRWALPFVDVSALDYRVLVKAVLEGNERSFVLEPGASTLRATVERRQGLLPFFALGLLQAGASPAAWRQGGAPRLPAGLDHFLFLFALLLAPLTLQRATRTVLAFAAASGLTLVLCALGLAGLPERLADAAVALTVIYAAAEALTRLPANASARGGATAGAQPRWQGLLAAAFGLVHGFVLARPLTELRLGAAALGPALTGYWLGIVCGLSLLLLLFLPLVALWQRRPAFRRTGTSVCASAIGLAGCAWFVSRAFF